MGQEVLLSTRTTSQRKMTTGMTMMTTCRNMIQNTMLRSQKMIQVEMQDSTCLTIHLQLCPTAVARK